PSARKYSAISTHSSSRRLEPVTTMVSTPTRPSPSPPVLQKNVGTGKSTQPRRRGALQASVEGWISVIRRGSAARPAAARPACLIASARPMRGPLTAGLAGARSRASLAPGRQNDPLLAQVGGTQLGGGRDLQLGQLDPDLAGELEDALVPVELAEDDAD